VDEGHSGTSGYGAYVAVWASLILLSAATVLASYVDVGMINIVVALFIASVKASLVALYFMHLKQESPLVWGFALTPIVFLVLLIAGTLSDTLFR
jgi:cytochrome c oxidase subunit IV